MNYNEIITEGLSTILFHFTNVMKVYDIFKTDSFHLVSDVGTEAEYNIRNSKDKIYYMSCSRSKTGEYHFPTSKSNLGASMFIIDGKKLMADGYSGGAVDYWGWDKEVFDNNGNKYVSGPLKDEMEDRIYSSKPTIPNVLKYIKEIHIYYNPAESYFNDVNNISAKLRKIIIHCKKNNLPIYVYNDVENFNRLDKKGLIDDLSILNGSDNNPVTRQSRDYLEPYIELMYKDKDKLSPKAKDILNYIKRYELTNSIQSLSTEIHNMKTMQRDNVDNFIKHMRKHKLKTLSDVINFIDKRFD